MKKIIGIIIAGAALSLLVMSYPVEAQYCNTVQRVVQTRVVNNVQVVDNIVPVAVVSPYPVVAVPVFSYVNAVGYAPGVAYQGAGYYPPQQGYAPQQPQQQLTADQMIDLAYKKFKAESAMAAQPGNGPPPIPQAKTPVTGVAGDGSISSLLVQKGCAKCHSGIDAGGGLSFFQGNQLRALTRDEKADIFHSVYEGTMPKKSSGLPTLNDQEVELVRQWSKQR